MSERQPIRRALVSVYDKSGLDQLAKALIDAQVEVVSTGSTAKELASHGVTVTEVSEITGFPECLTDVSRPCTRRCTPGSSPTAA